MSASEFSERVKIATAAGDVAEVERLLASDWCAQWTAARAKDVLDEIRGGGTLTPDRAVHHCLLVAITTANRLHAAQAECNALRKRIEEIEARPTLGYKGVWDPRQGYNEGDFATDRGSVWYARRATRARPGEADDWVLAVKRGKDAR